MKISKITHLLINGLFANCSKLLPNLVKFWIIPWSKLPKTTEISRIRLLAKIPKLCAISRNVWTKLTETVRDYLWYLPGVVEGPVDHSSFINSWGMSKSGNSNSWCARISLKLPWSLSRAQKKTLFTSDIRFKMTCRTLHRLVESFTRDIYAVDSAHFFQIKLTFDRYDKQSKEKSANLNQYWLI